MGGKKSYSLAQRLVLAQSSHFIYQDALSVRAGKLCVTDRVLINLTPFISLSLIREGGQACPLAFAEALAQAGRTTRLPRLDGQGLWQAGG